MVIKMKNTACFIRFYDSPVGRIALPSDGDSLTGLYIKNQTGYPGAESSINVSPVLLTVFKTAERWLDDYFSGIEPKTAPPISVSGTEFQKTVWDRLKLIPYGQTVTYGELAAEIAEKRGMKRMSAQAVGNAVGKNPVSIIVPCHRVIGSDGSLTGYNGGLEIKEKLLTVERGESI